MDVRSGMSLLWDVFLVAQHCDRLLEVAMRDSPLTPKDYALYSGVFAYGPLSTSDLARQLGIPITTMHDHVRELESRGHLERRTDPRDARAKLLLLTDDGRAILRAAADHFTPIEPLLLDALRLEPAQVRDALMALTAACDSATDALQLGELAA